MPAEAEEAVRDLVRARAALLADRKRAQQRITAMLLRHGRVWRSGSYWTLAHEQWIASQRFGEPALAAALAHYRAALDTRRTELAAVEAELKPWTARPPLAEAVGRLGCYRGIAELTGLVLAAEVVDWRRFPSARAFMGFTGLVPSEYSSGERTRRGAITKAGSAAARTALIEAAWSYRHQPAIGATLRRRKHEACGVPEIGYGLGMIFLWLRRRRLALARVRLSLAAPSSGSDDLGTAIDVAWAGATTGWPCGRCRV